MAIAPMETCMFVDYLVDIGLKRSDCAAWVQAWGSILAIVATVSTVAWQLRRQQKVKLAEEEAGYTRKLEYCYQLTSGAAKVSEKIVSFIGASGIGSRDGQAALAEVSVFCDAFTKFDPSSMRTTTLFHAALAADALTRLLRREVEDQMRPSLPTERPSPTATRELVDEFFKNDRALQARAKNRQAVVAQLGEQLREQAETIAIALRARRILPQRADLIRKGVTDVAKDGENSH